MSKDYHAILAKQAQANTVFDLKRIQAINEYSRLESALAGVLRNLIGCDPPTGLIVFFGLSNTRSRYAMISRLSKIKFDGFYSKSWPQIERWLIPIDQTRNQIVHWATGEIINPIEYSQDNPRDYRYTLNDRVLYNALNGDPSLKSSLTLSDLESFIDDVVSMTEVVQIFFRAMMSHGSQLPWWNKFNEPIKYRTAKELLSSLSPENRPSM